MSISLRCLTVLLTAIVAVGCDHDVERTTGPSSPTSSPPKSDVATDLPANPSVSAGMLFACGLAKSGTVVCWGQDVHDYWHPPYGLPTPGGVFAQVDGTYQTACGVSPAGQISCWGRAHTSQMNPPAPSDALTYRQVSVGPFTACGLLSNGGVTCWGSDAFGLPNEFGLLNPPTDAFTQVSVGYTHACGLRSDGTL